ncbi:MAG: glutathione S-transferase N-terminal domain-containing protein [Chlamydiota bacterium]
MVKRYFYLLLCIITLGVCSSYASPYTLTLYSSPNCPYCQKVIYYLQKEGKSIPIKNIQDKTNKAELIKIGGKSQIPCLIINGKPLYESSDIIKWLQTHKNNY